MLDGPHVPRRLSMRPFNYFDMRSTPNDSPKKTEKIPYLRSKIASEVQKILIFTRPTSLAAVQFRCVGPPLTLNTAHAKSSDLYSMG